MLNLFKKKINKGIENQNVGFDINTNNEKKEFSYTKEVFDLTSKIKNNIDLLVEEEGTMTYGLDNLLKGEEYTTKQTAQVNEHLQVLTQNSDKTNNLVNDVFQSLDNSQKEIKNAKNDFSELMSQINAVSNVFEEFIALISDLQTHYSSIQGFASIITGIAQKTNLLSLNASIEAARAGEVGKGFAVVASEIKKLSDDTQKNAQDIMSSLENLTSYMDKLTNKSNEGSGVINKTTELVKESSSLLDNISEAELEVQQHVQEVQDSQQDNLSGIKEISSSLTNLVDKSKSENEELKAIIYGIQKKADCYMHIINDLNQIKILENEDA